PRRGRRHPRAARRERGADPAADRRRGRVLGLHRSGPPEGADVHRRRHRGARGRRHPRRARRRGRRGARSDDPVARRSRRRDRGQVPRGAGALARRARRRDPQGDDRGQDGAGARRHRAAQQGHPPAARRGARVPAVAGEIVAAAGLKEATTGDTICDPRSPILLERIDTYEPVISQAIEADNAAAKERLDFALNKMVEEDPTFRTHEDAETGQTLIRGMGELHLEIIVDRMKREYGVQARAGKPQVVYRETVLGEGEGHAVFERDLKEQAIYGEATCKVRGRPRGSGMDFKRALPAGALLPDGIVQAAMQGLRDAASSGPDGYPLEDVEVTLTLLKLQEGANGEIGSRAAAAEAFRRAVQHATPSRLEPIMAVEVTVDDEFLGAVIGDLN